jgi:hypothetical protein
MSSGKLRKLIIRIVGLLLVILLIYLTRREVDEVNCIQDITYKYTEAIYNYLRVNELTRNSLQIVIFGVLDVFLIFSIFIWITYAETWRPLISFILFQVLRFLLSFGFELRRDEDMIWRYSGIPFLTTSYYQYTSNDSLSAGVGIYMIIVSELYEEGYKIGSIIASLAFVSYSFLLICLRVDYIVTILLSLVLGHYSYLSIKMCASFIDTYLLDLKNNQSHKHLQEEKEKVVVIS